MPYTSKVDFTVIESMVHLFRSSHFRRSTINIAANIMSETPPTIIRLSDSPVFAAPRTPVVGVGVSVGIVVGSLTTPRTPVSVLVTVAAAVTPATTGTALAGTVSFQVVPAAASVMV